MENMVINRAKLLEILSLNLDIHKKLYEEAIIAFRDNYLSKLEEFRKKFDSTGECTLDFGLRKPESREKDYQRVIRMVELEVRDKIELSEREFARYVLNDWEWMDIFRISYYSNMSTSSSSCSKSTSSTDSSETKRKRFSTEEEETKYFGK